MEYKILDFLQKAKNTATPAYSLEEILKALNVEPGSYKDVLGYMLALSESVDAVTFLDKSGRILSKNIQIEGKFESTTYYMAK